MAYERQNFTPGNILKALELIRMEDAILAAVSTEEQELTPEQQAQARKNTGAISIEEAAQMLSGGGTAVDYDRNVRAVNHRGYSVDAPENTLPAYILSKLKGFTCVEADVSFTSDGVAVLLHDSTIDRTSNGSGNISSMTYAEASKYDYGSWKGAKYAGTKIPTFEEFIILCKRIGLHPYIELKQNGAYTQDQIQTLVTLVKNCGMAGKVTWISFANTYLEYVKSADKAARLGYLYSPNVVASTVTFVKGLQTGENEVFLDVNYSNLKADGVQLCIDADIPLEVWTVNDESVVLALDPYVTGVTSDYIIAGKTLYDEAIGHTDGPAVDAYPLLHSWDLTKSLTDKVSGVVATTTGQRGADGLTLDEINTYCDFGAVYDLDRTYEIDVVRFDRVYDDTYRPHARVWGVDTDPNTEQGACTLCHEVQPERKGWRFYCYSTGGWCGEISSEMTGTEENGYAQHYFDGKTLKIYVDKNRYATLYADDVELYTTEFPFPEYVGGHIYIGGDTGDAAQGLVVSGFRVYDGLHIGAT